MNKPNICVDFDGVINTYTGWNGPDDLYKPRQGVKEFLTTLSETYNLIIFTVRDVWRVREWMKLYSLPFDEITNKKVGAIAYIDDRALKFTGNYNETLNELRNFKAHWEE